MIANEAAIGGNVSGRVAKEVLTWDRISDASRELANAVNSDGYRPDLVLAVARGGLVPAGALSYALDVKNVHVMNIKFYTGVNERMDQPVVGAPVPQAADLHGASVLIVDDVADTGGTLQVVREFCADHVAEVRCAVLYEKPQSVVTCEYVWRRTDRWIEFPWEDGMQVA